MAVKSKCVTCQASTKGGEDMTPNGNPTKGPRANWKLTLEFTGDDGEGEPSTTTISRDGKWSQAKGGSPPNECIAIDMSIMLVMLLQSGCVVGASDLKETVSAFSDVLDM